MDVTARATGHALADLAATLAAATSPRLAPWESTDGADQVDAVLQVAANATAQLIGDGGFVRLADNSLTVDHPDRAEALAAALGSTTEPVVLSTVDLDRAGVSACLFCPLVVDGTYLGYLGAVRTTPGGSYSESDLDLACGIAGEVGLALANIDSASRLRMAEERYRRLVEITPDGVWQLDADGVTTFVNEPMASMLGLPRERLVGTSADGFLDDESKARLPQWLGRTSVHQATLVRADGSNQPVRIAAAPVPDEHNQPGCSLWLVSDAADRLQARGLKRQLDHLRRLDSLGQLIGGIAHDFNNLLTVMAGSAEVLASEAEPGSTQHKLATEIASGAARGRTLAHQLLAFGRGGGSPGRVSVADLLDDMTQLLSRTLGEHIQLDIAADPDVWPVRAERGPLEQVLVNLAANGRDAMRRGGVLTIRAGNGVDDPDLAGRFVRLTVADTGTGMDDVTQRRAMDAFYTTKPAAAGLGLATAASIVRGGGGHIRLESTPRLGTTVTLLLPAAEPAVAEPPALPPAPTPASQHVLVVEDQPELAQLIRHLLERAGYAVTVATDPRTASAEGVRPDLLLTDVVMPGMTGPEFAATLRERFPELRVVYMSGYASTELDDPNMIQKPFNRDTLLTAVRRALA